ncbi:MAG: DNRLRE domain-containing protein, partial [Thermoanaerobaculia bacterium]
TRNDGVVVYQNGAEVLRRNMPWGLVSGSRTPASTDVSTTETVTIPVSALAAGTNVIAVELHQSIENDDDSGLFELGLTGRICQSCRVGEVELGGLVSTYINNETGKSTSNFDTSLKLEIDGSPAKKALLRWNTLPAVLTGADILKANLQVTVATGSGSSSGDPFGFYALLRSWDPATVTYAHPWKPDGIGPDDRGSARLGVTPLNPALGETVTIPLTEAGVQVVKQWVSGALANNGLVLQAEPGSDNGLDLQSDRTASPPRLTVLYVRPASVCTP